MGRKSTAALVAGAALALAATTSHAAARKYAIGVSNTLMGNGWREEMICSIKAQSVASGEVSRLIIANRNGGPSEQITDLRNLISAGVDAIVLNPSSRDALNPVLEQAIRRGIVVVAVDQAVSAKGAYVLSNDQVSYGRLGAEWLFSDLNGRGDVVEMRGIDGVPADSDRHEGFETALAKYKGIKVVATTSGKTIDGIWTSGIDAVVPDAYEAAHKPFVPLVGADNNAFIGQLIDWKSRGLVGAAVTNPASVGGAGLALALDVLDHKQEPRVIKLTPEVWSNTTDEGMAKLKAAYDPKLDPYYSVDTTITPWTTYSRAQLLACKGP
ncbi:MAG: substrate-binding domain-containing protein [Acetobacteraceae bacterium]|nr:substrate-binding domain-containing protein [Acetobacteraceae bacterium]